MKMKSKMFQLSSVIVTSLKILLIWSFLKITEGISYRYNQNTADAERFNREYENIDKVSYYILWNSYTFWTLTIA